MNTNLLYQYIADSSPYEAKAICNKYGFSLPESGQTSDIADCLEGVIGVGGQQAFLEILALHPDKDLILEQYGSPSMTFASTEKKPCGCGGDAVAKSDTVLNKYVPSESSTVMQQGNIFLIAAALLLAVAIITRP